MDSFKRQLGSDESALGQRLCVPQRDGPPFGPITGRPSRPAEGGTFRPMATAGMVHVPVSRQKRFRAKTVGSLFRCRSAGTITTIPADNGVATALW